MKFNLSEEVFPDIGIGVLVMVDDGKYRYMTIAEYRGNEWWDRVSFPGYTNPHIIPLNHVKAWASQTELLNEWRKQMPRPTGKIIQ